MKQSIVNINGCIADFLKDYKYIDKGCLNIINNKSYIKIGLKGSYKFTKYNRSCRSGKYYRENGKEDINWMEKLHMN